MLATVTCVTDAKHAVMAYHLWQLRQVMAVGKLLSAITLWRSALTEFRMQLALPGPQPKKPTLLPQPVAATKERLDVKATYTK